MHPGELSTATMMGATAEHIVAANEATGIEVGLPPSAVRAHYRRVIDGRGGDNWTRIIDGIRDPRPAGSRRAELDAR